jgi:UDP-GlcNAc:undecaprenyl-phosphate/decaprenyl-phosphate GlcNAc-1-phosphate transferase
MNTIYIFSPLFAFILSLIIIPVLTKGAQMIQLIDKPNYRKVHQISVPLIGGIAIFISSAFTLALTIDFDRDIAGLRTLFIGIFVLLLLGALDDRFDIRASLKLTIQLLLAHFVFTQGIRIESFYGIFGIYELTLQQQYIMTILVVTGVVNAFNLMDGIDGLAGGLALCSFLIFAILAWHIGNWNLLMIFITFAGSLVGFLRFNLSKAGKIFMGDAGSLMLGFLLVVTGIKLMQDAHLSTFSSYIHNGVIAIFMLPVLDALRVFRKRIKTGKSPFAADKTHIHHLFLNLGLKHKIAAFLIIVLALFIIAMGYFIAQFTGITLSVVAMLLAFYTITSFLEFTTRINNWKIRIRQMENK